MELELNQSQPQASTEWIFRNPGPHWIQGMELLGPPMAALGYSLVHLEVQKTSPKVLRVFIDHLNSAQPIGIEDCVKVSKGLESFLDESKEIDGWFRGEPYEFEVSSPGLERPLWTQKDLIAFAGRQVLVSLYQKFLQRKKFKGKLLGLEIGSNGKEVGIEVDGSTIKIPVEFISKVNLELEEGKI
jgi:ribosome maturation factor RimP